MKFKIGDRIKIEWQAEDFDSGSLVGETGIIVGYAIKKWHDGDFIIDLDCGIEGIIYDSDLLKKINKRSSLKARLKQ